MPNLVGIGNSQVPTNAMLGGLAYQDPAHANLENVEIEKIAAIKARIDKSPLANNENGVFVYNTANDSDGGAWRHRTQHTSWYNEEPSEFRGHRKEFPSIAVIVTDTDEVAIYDGDDPNLSMWMRFKAFSGGGGMEPNYVLQYSGSTYRTCALNGILVIGQGSGGDNWGNPIVNFISEEIERADPQTSEGGRWSGNIASRNGYNGAAAEGFVDKGRGFVIANSRIRGLAMKVLDNAMIDPRTGLPIPTIAYATHGSGITVITANNDSSTPRKVNDITASAGSSYDVCNFVEFTETGHLIFEQDGSNGRSIFFIPVPTADRTSSTNDGAITDKVVLKPYPVTKDYPRFNEMLSTNSGISYGIPMKGPDHALISHAGKVTIVKPNISTPAKGMTAYITKDYNTGWMYGGCRNVWLASTDATFDNTNHVTNGEFGTDSTGWTGSSNTSSISIVSGALRVTSTANGTWSGPSVMYQMASNFVVGKTYSVSYKVRSGGTTGNYSSGFGSRIQKGTSFHSSNTLSYSSTTSDPGSSWVYISWTFTAEQTQYGLQIYNFYGVINSYFEIDDVVVREAVEDRAYIQANSSQNQKNGLGNGLEIKGTLTKAPIYPGSELVYYTGFSGSNRLWQESNSNLNFGTNDYYMSVWAYGGGSSECLMVKERPDTDTGGALLLFQTSGYYKFYSRTGASWVHFNSNVDYGTHWVQLYLVRRGNTIEGYCNGIYQGNAAMSGSTDGTSTYPTEIGIGRRVVSNSQPYTGRLALAKIGTGAPTAEEIQRIYADERKLFAPNAKCTLYGSSDDIKTMAYDKSTDILNLGTTSGRSDFVGLNRINNTTTSTTTAISAAGGLIAEAS